MRTDDLIRALANDVGTMAPPPQRTVSLAVLAGLLIAVPLFLVAFGVRGDIARIISSWRFDLKMVATLALAIAAFAAARRLMRPDTDPRAALAPLLVGPLLLLAGLGVELATVPADRWAATMLGNNALVCLTAVPLLSTAPLAALLYGMRNGAPASPAWAGAGAGLLASGLGAVLYATHCTDDSPLFVATWYSIAILAVTGVGALLGSRLLRW
ncbi:MAG: NrsF family protein [Hyphomicrobiaceae bacterium]